MNGFGDQVINESERQEMISETSIKKRFHASLIHAQLIEENGRFINLRFEIQGSTRPQTHKFLIHTSLGKTLILLEPSL